MCAEQLYTFISLTSFYHLCCNQIYLCECCRWWMHNSLFVQLFFNAWSYETYLHHMVNLKCQFFWIQITGIKGSSYLLSPALSSIGLEEFAVVSWEKHTCQPYLFLHVLFIQRQSSFIWFSKLYCKFPCKQNPFVKA